MICDFHVSDMAIHNTRLFTDFKSTMASRIVLSYDLSRFRSLKCRFHERPLLRFNKVATTGVTRPFEMILTGSRGWTRVSRHLVQSSNGGPQGSQSSRGGQKTSRIAATIRTLCDAWVASTSSDCKIAGPFSQLRLSPSDSCCLGLTVQLVLPLCGSRSFLKIRKSA
jgi:hypothetical protein